MKRFSDEFMDRFYDRKNCIICNGNFWVRRKKCKGSRGPSGLRRTNSVTCSDKCSKIYRRNGYKAIN